MGLRHIGHTPSVGPGKLTAATHKDQQALVFGAILVGILAAAVVVALINRSRPDVSELERKVGQLILVVFDGTNIHDNGVRAVQRPSWEAGSAAALTTAIALALSVAGNAVNANNSGLPDPGFEIVRGTTALLVTDPQNDFLSPLGITWGIVGKKR